VAVLRRDVNPNKVVLAVARAIIAKFDRSKWLELGLLTDTQDRIESHGRLLRSLDWGDDDYDGHVLQMVPHILGRVSRPGKQDTFEHFEVVEEFVALPQWLRENDTGLYTELYPGQHHDTAVDDLQATAASLGLPDVDEYAVRIRRGLRDDPAQAIGSAKELLEMVLKAVLELHGTGKETKLEIPKLLKDANVKLGLDPGGVRGAEPGAEQRRKSLGALGQLVTGIAELRNAGFGTGHGVSQRPELDVATARLAVSAAVAAATFYIEAHGMIESVDSEQKWVLSD
jgi:hypothetical protein